MNRTPKQGIVAEPIDTEAFDADALLSKCGVILQREIRNLLIATSSGRKLDPAESKDLVSYIKLLSEIRIEQADTVANMSDADLQKVVKS